MNKTKRDAGKSPGIGEELKLDGRLITTSLGAGRKVCGLRSYAMFPGTLDT